MIYIPKFIFKMQNILNIKYRLEESKKQELMILIDKLEKEKLILKNLYFNRNNEINSLNNIYNLKKISIIDLKCHNNYLVFIKNKINNQKDIIKKINGEVNKARLELKNKIKERKILEKFKEKQYDKYLKNEIKLEQKIIDEIISYKHKL